jgi:hypothetical protein
MAEGDSEKISELLDRVVDQPSFIRFVEALAEDR